MTVFRVQDKKGCGPYNSPDMPLWLLKHNGDKRRPGVVSDRKIARYLLTDRDFFGFASIHQLLKWFTKTELKLLYRAGFKVVRVDGEVVARSSHQIIFRHKKAV